MQAVIVSSAAIRAPSLCLAAGLNAYLAHRVAEAFTEQSDHTNEMHALLINTFGQRQYKRYCLDFSSYTIRISFSDLDNPRTLNFQGVPVAIASPDAAIFSLQLQLADYLKPKMGSSRGATHASAITRL